MNLIQGSITAVRGITAFGKNIGIKPAKPDFAVIFSEKKASAAAVYTKQRLKLEKI